MRLTLAGVSVSVGILSVVACGAVAAEIPPMPKLKTFSTQVPLVEGGKAKCFIAVPNGPEYAQLGERLADAIWRGWGTKVEVKVAGDLSPEEVEKSNAVLLGYFANNPLVERLYDERFVCLDARWPGEGGYVIRTVHDPFGRGASFVYLGGADAAAVGAAVDDFLATLPEKGDVVCPHTVKIVPPDGLLTHKPDPEAVRRRVESAEGRSFNTLANMFCKAGLDYHRTGNPDELDVFKGVVPVFAELVRRHDRLEGTWGQLCFADVWDVIEEAPQFGPEDRAQVTQLLWDLTHRSSYFGRTAKDAPFPEGNLSSTRMVIGLARYWKKYYDLDVGGLSTWANTRSQSQAKFWRAREDCPGYGSITLCDTVFYVLHYGYEKYWEDGTGRKMADYGVAIINNLGGIAGFGDTSAMGSSSNWPVLFRVAGWKLKDGRYLAAEAHASGGGGVPLVGGYFQEEIQPGEPVDMLGVHVVPLPDWVWQQRSSVLTTAPSSMNAALDADPLPPREQCFDKITFRTSFDAQDQYLILGGVSHGYHAHPDGNAIIELTDEGRYCLFDSGYFVPDTIEHNTLVVFRDGLFEPVPRLTGLAALGDFARLGMTQTYVGGYNGADWHRNVIWNKEKFFLVIDQVEAVEPGDYRILAVFRTLDDDKPQVGSDRVRARYGGKDFCLVSGSHTPLKIAGTTPAVATRHAIVESKAITMAAGQRQYFVNLLYSTRDRENWPYEIVPAAPGAVMIKTPDGYGLAGAGTSQPVGQVQMDAALFYVEPCGFALTSGRRFCAGQTTFASDAPVDIDVRLGATATGTIEAESDSVVHLCAKAGTVRLDDQPATTRPARKGLEFDVPPGAHTLSFVPPTDRIDAIPWAETYARLKRDHEQQLAQTEPLIQEGRRLQPAWKVETAATEQRVFYVDGQGNPVEDLTNAGKAMCWTEAQRGASPRNAVDGDPATYSATSTALQWTNDLPKDIGMEWDSRVEVGCLQIDYYSSEYAPTVDGQQLQAWDGEAWYSIEADVAKDKTGANWTYRFSPIKTSRIRVFITEFSGVRTAVREMRVFPESATAETRDVRVPARANGLAAFDVDADGRSEVLLAAGRSVKCIRGDGIVAWEQKLQQEALCVAGYDFGGDGRGEVVVGGQDHKLYCFDEQGKPLWAVETPADPHFAGTEPASGPVTVVGCADMDGDGECEIVAGSGNWFAYGYDKEGNLLWTKLNWAHPPTSIAFVDLTDNRRGALIGTKYCAANLIGPGGEQVASVSVGYHGAAMSVAAGDMDGNGKPELLVGSRVGGVHCKELGTGKEWSRFMGAEVSQVALADLNGDGKRELIAGSKNSYVLAIDAEGNILWRRDVGHSILDLVVVDGSADGKPEIAVATEGGTVRLLGADGQLLGTMHAQADVAKIVAANLDGNGSPQVVAGSADGFVYGDIE